MNLSETEKRERKQVVDLILNARTLAEVGQASLALSSWHKAHPDDDTIFVAGDRLYHAKNYAESRDASGRAQGFKGQSAQERERVFVQAECAQSVAEIVCARKELLLWQNAHPNCDNTTVQELLQFLNRQEAVAHIVEESLREPEASEIKQGTNGTAHTKYAEAALSKV